MRSRQNNINARRKHAQSLKLDFQNLEPRKLLAANLGGQIGPIHHAPTQPSMHGELSHGAMSSESSCHNQHNHNPAIMNLVTDAQATHVAIQSGNWSDPNVWQNGEVPSENARIVISEGQTVTVDQVYNDSFKTIRIDGTLNFATNVNTQIKVDTLVSTACGRLEIGTQSTPIQSQVTAKVIFADDGEIDRDWDPTEVSRGAILMGTTEIHGAETTDRGILEIQPVAGTRNLRLTQAPTNWQVGDQVVITGTQGATSDEVRTIEAISGRTIRLNQTLTLDHRTPNPDLNVHLVNKTRNVEFRSENTDIPRRGHIMFAHTHNVKIDFAGFYDLGRTDKSRDLDDVHFEFFEDVVGNRAGAPIHYQVEIGEEPTNRRGRYALHFHRGGVDRGSTPAVVNGSVVDGSPGWGFVNHSSHVNFTDNVAYGVWGAAYYTEAGNEIGTFDGNIAIHSVNPRDPVDPDTKEIATDLGHEFQEFGNSGDGFWLSGHLVSMKNNISSGGTGHGFIIWSDGLVEHDLGEDSGRTTVKTSNFDNGHLITGRDEVPVWWAPLAEISNNEASGSVIGFRTRYIHSNGYVGEGGSPFHASPDQAYIDTLSPTVDGLKIWGNREGVLMNYSERMSLKNAHIIGIGERFVDQEGTTDIGVGLDLANVISRGSGRIENVTIEGFGMGIMSPRNDQWVMDNVTLKNTTDMLIKEARLGPRTMTMSNFTFGSLEGTAVEGTEGERRNIAFGNVDFTDGSAQPYFFLLPDHITMDGVGIYSNNQHANFVPLEEAPDGNPIEEVPDEYIGLTNEELQNEFGLSFGGNLIPQDGQNADWLTGGVLGMAAPAATQFPRLYDMTSGGDFREPPKGGPVPELTGNRLELSNGETVVMMITNLNTTDTDSELRDLTYSVSEIEHGYFAHRDNPTQPITSFTQAEINGGVIRFVHDGSGTAPDYRVTVTDGTTTTPVSVPVIIFDGEDGGGGGGGDQQTQEIGYSGIAQNVNHYWTTITLPQSFNNPVVIAGGSSRNGTQQGVVRIQNVTSNSFQIRFQEWDYLDGGHMPENIGYLVVEAGSYELTDGTKVTAGTIDLTHERYGSVDFSTPFGNTPIVLAQTMTTRGPAAITERIRNVSASGFQIQMQEEEAANHTHNTETTGWLAIEQNNGSSGETSFRSMLVNGVNHRRTTVEFGDIGGATAPVILTDMQTRNGGDTATVRHQSSTANQVTLFVEEERSRDAELGHARENIGLLAFEPGTLVAKQDSGGESISGSGPDRNSSADETIEDQVDHLFANHFASPSNGMLDNAVEAKNKLSHANKRGDSLASKEMQLAGSVDGVHVDVSQSHDHDSDGKQEKSKLEGIDQVIGDLF